MAGDERQLRVGQLAVDDVQVGAADPACEHPEQDLARPRLGDLQILEPQRLARRVQHHRPHEVIVDA